MRQAYSRTTRCSSLRQWTTSTRYGLDSDARTAVGRISAATLSCNSCHLSDFDFEVLAPLPCSCIETNYLRTRLTDATSRSSSRHRASRDQLPETTTRRIRRTAGVFGRQTCGRCRRPSRTMLHWTALQNALRRNERRSARACNYSSINTMHFGIDTMYKYSHSCR